MQSLRPRTECGGKQSCLYTIQIVTRSLRPTAQVLVARDFVPRDDNKPEFPQAIPVFSFLSSWKYHYLFPETSFIAQICRNNTLCATAYRTNQSFNVFCQSRIVSAQRRIYCKGIRYVHSLVTLEVLP